MRKNIRLWSTVILAVITACIGKNPVLGEKLRFFNQWYTDQREVAKQLSQITKLDTLFFFDNRLNWYTWDDSGLFNTV